MDYIIQLQTEREELLSPVFNTEQISLSQIKLPTVQPILNDINREIHVTLYDNDTDEIGNTFTYVLDHDRNYPNPSISELVTLMQESMSGWTVDQYGDMYITISHPKRWTFNSFHSILGSPVNNKAFSPNLSPPNIHVTLGDQEEWWRSKIGEQTALMADTECGCTFVDTVSEHQVFSWQYRGKTIKDVRIKFEWEHGGQMWPYDFMGRAWIVKVIIRGELDRRRTHQSDQDGSEDLPVLSFSRFDSKRIKEVALIVIVVMALITLASMKSNRSLRTRGPGSA